MAPLYCGHLEQEIIFNQERNQYLPYISHWQKYIENVWFVWAGSESLLKDFHTFVNTNNYNQRFTIAYSQQQMIFLDILVYKDGNGVGSNLYRNPADKNSLLHGHF